MRVFLIRWSLFLLLFALTVSLTGQPPAAGPYHLSWKRELLYGGGGAAAVGTGYLIDWHITNVPLAELRLPRVSAFDRGAISYNSGTAKTASDVLAYGSLALPGLLLFDRDSRQDAGKLAILLAETMLINQGVTDIIKGSVRRPRPYLYSDDLDPARVAETYDRKSFPSAHTSNTATAAFFFGRAFSDYYPQSKLRPYVWTVAAGLPAVTGYLRVRAGEHFPTDVLAGYALGAAVGYTVPVLHRRALGTRGLTVTPTGPGLYLSYQF
ncbi:phosphatase PAP2 family protein [Neolewinella sp.]|uniref:phosphatase PAP2 family protein n=1 Tax=Neolewinella sp. TaxID=2993543 RepID=UPI003B51593C